MDPGAKRFAPAAERNRDPLLQALRAILPAKGTVLEIASGTGQHADYFSEHLPHVAWQPSDVDPSAHASIDAYRRAAERPNFLPPIHIDVRDDDWPIDRADAVIAINLIHISPWECTEALMRGAARLLSPGAALVLYGPYRFDGEYTAPSNAAFDASLRAQDPAWAVRDLRDIDRAARTAGFSREEVIAMPANNHVLVFRRSER